MPSSIHSDDELNCEGLVCPMPLLKTQQRLRTLMPGQILCIRATDAGAKADFQAFCQQAGHTLLQSEQRSTVYYFWIQKGGL